MFIYIKSLIVKCQYNCSNPGLTAKTKSRHNTKYLCNHTDIITFDLLNGSHAEYNVGFIFNNLTLHRADAQPVFKITQCGEMSGNDRKELRIMIASCFLVTASHLLNLWPTRIWTALDRAPVSNYYYYYYKC